MSAAGSRAAAEWKHLPAGCQRQRGSRAARGGGVDRLGCRGRGGTGLVVAVPHVITCVSHGRDSDCCSRVLFYIHICIISTCLHASPPNESKIRERYGCGVERQLFSFIKREEARCAPRIFSRVGSATRESTRTGGELSANAERISENPTEHLAANYN